MGARRRASKSHATSALLLRRTPYRDADLVLSLFTEQLGQISALARAARKSQRRFGGSLEPFHTLRVELEETLSSELMTLQTAQIATARTGLYEHLESMEAAGKFSGWIRHASPAHTPEPSLWALAQSCMDQLDAVAGARRALGPEAASASARLVLVTHGLQLLSACGWRLEFERCVQSGVRCPDGKSAMLDSERGGLVFSAEGGAPFIVSGATRRRLIAAQAGQMDALELPDGELGLELVERCLRAHAGLES
ncbi:MAG TPA: DNA repair protein RecO [Polyangiaceae bacterium]|nr:DNA repair protein RecO [Polyangiaceae bacterium]